MVRKKLLKILSVLVVIIITSSLFLIPTSALDQTVSFDDFFDSYTASIYSVSSDGVFTDVTQDFTTTWHGNILGIYVTPNSNINYQSHLFVQINFRLNDKFSSFGYSYGGFNIKTTIGNTPRTTFSFLESYRNYAKRVGGSDTFDGSISLYDDGFNARVNFNKNGYESSIYQVALGYVLTIQQNLTPGMAIHNYFTDLEYYFTTKEGIIVDSITQNQDENTDKIINGWSSDFELDTKTFDDYKAQEDKILADSSQGRSEAVSLFNNFHFDANLQQGLYCATAIITDFVGNFDTSWFHSLLKISLVIGIFGFVIGTAQLVVGKFSSNNRSSGKRGK